MTTRTRKDQVSLLDDKIAILESNATDACPTRKVFRTVGAILALVRDKMVTDKDSVQLSEYCFNVCETLRTRMQVENVDDLSEAARGALDDLERVICEIERTLRRGASTPRMEHGKSKIERHKLEIQETLNVLNMQNSSLGGDDRVGERASKPLADDCRDSPAASTPQSDSNTPAFERLVSRKFVPHELPTLIEQFLMCADVGVATRRLPKDDAQTFIDVIDEALDMPDLSPWARKQCLKPLYRICGLYALLPKSLTIPTCYDRTSIALYRGGYADVWKGEYFGRDVAVKVMRVYSNSDLRKILGRFCKEVVTWKTLRHPNVLPLIGVIMSGAQFAMVSDWMANGNINEFVKANSDANRLELLRDVSRGLIYIHEQGMIHGDLKGANILIDQTRHARLADFGLLMVLSDPANLLSSSSYTQGGTARWMSPELIAPQELGLDTSRPTKASDCYSLGMVIYETISGNLPFHEDTDLAVFLKVVRGERPRRTPGFTRSLWKKLKQCWVPHPDDRPSIEGVLQCLEMCNPSDMDKQSAPTLMSIDADYDHEDARMSEEPPDISAQDEADVTRCICGDESDTSEVMIQCDDCMVWQHITCMGIEVPPDDTDYFCEECRPDLHPNLFNTPREDLGSP